MCDLSSSDAAIVLWSLLRIVCSSKMREVDWKLVIEEACMGSVARKPLVPSSSRFQEAPVKFGFVGALIETGEWWSRY